MDENPQKPSQTQQEKLWLEYVASRVSIMFKCYRSVTVSDPEVIIAGAVAVLARWPRQVVEAVTEPGTGLPSRSKWPPSLAEIREACEEANAPIARKLARERAAHGLPPPERKRPTPEQLDAQFARLNLSHLRVGASGAPPPRTVRTPEQDKPPSEPAKEPPTNPPLDDGWKVSPYLRKAILDAAVSA